MGLCWVVFVLVWIIAAASTKRTVARPRNQGVYRVLWFVAFTCLFLGSPRRRTTELLARSMIPARLDLAFGGLVVVLGGLALAFWARATLGRNWSATITLKENHTLVQTGPYRSIRHPIYTAILLMFLGSAIAYGTAGALLAFPIAAVGFLIKARHEEALMQQHFPDVYPEYRLRTRMLVPGVY